MDLQTFLISVVVFIILALLIWLITSLTVRERPFEERLEEQRKMEQMLLGGKQSVVKKEKPKKKSKKMKSGERESGETENIAKGKTGKMVELEIDPEVIETSLSEPPVNIIEKKAKLGKAAPGSPTTTVKPILLNKEEKSFVQKSDKAPELKHRSVRKDEVELKHDREGKKTDVQNKISTAVVNGFHSESTDGSDDAPVIATRAPAEQLKLPVSESKSKKQRQEQDTASHDGGLSRVSNITTKKAISNDVTVSGRNWGPSFIS